jgi:hypothetical protein
MQSGACGKIDTERKRLLSGKGPGKLTSLAEKESLGIRETSASDGSVKITSEAVEVAPNSTHFLIGTIHERTLTKGFDTQHEGVVG